jgi:mRNA interferase HigB
MHVISYKTIIEFIKDHPDAELKLGRWYKWMKRGKFRNLNDIKGRFPGVDYIGNDRYVFNISGNKYRLIAVVFLSTQIVLIRFIGTHAEYNKINALKV